MLIILLFLILFLILQEEDGGGSSLSNYTPTLMIDDYNVRKSYKFQFDIDRVREDTKFFFFLKDYTRNNYNSVTADFQVISVTTPEGYDYSNYYNYMYYDNREKKLYLPAGCFVKIYEGSGNNNTTIDLDLMSSATIPHFNLGALTNLSYSGTIFLGEYNYSSLIPTNYRVSSSFIGNVITTILNNLSLQVGGSPSSIRFNVIDNFLQYLDVPMTTEEFRFSTYLLALYYGNITPVNVSYDSNFDDFIFANSNIISYENTKYDNMVDNTYYRFFRSTNVYNQENMINQNLYRFQYTDSEDVSSLLPSGMSTEYLSSPFYTDNYNSSSGGNITYNITEIFYGDNNVNYGEENSSLRVEPEPQFYDDNSTDNTSLDNDTTDKIDNTSEENWFKNIYKLLLDIKDSLSKLGNNLSSAGSNITYNISQNFNYLFMPNPLELQDLLDGFGDLCSEHLGVVYQPFDFFTFVLGSIADLTTPDYIKLHIPEVVFHDATLIPEYTFDFATILENNTFYTIHQIVLSAVDLMFIVLISRYAMSVFKEVFGSNDN